MEVKKESVIQNSFLGLPAAVCQMCLWLCGASFGVTPIEDRGLRFSGCRFGGSFGATYIEDRGFRLPGCLPGVAAEAQSQ